MEVEFSLFRLGRQSGFSRFFSPASDKIQNSIYNDFIAFMLEGGLGAFFLEYPVLARLLVAATETWVDAASELIIRVHADYSLLQATFAAGMIGIGKVLSIKSSISDRHNQGRSVAVITFENGLKVIYKPKCLQLEQAYFHLLDWLNKQGISLDFKVLRMLAMEDYGWIEYVDHLPCYEKEEIEDIMSVQE